MTINISEKVNMVVLYDQNKNLAMPKTMQWQNRLYNFSSLSFHQSLYQGKKLLHIFYVSDGNSDFRLLFDTQNLSWTLSEVTDGTSP